MQVDIKVLRGLLYLVKTCAFPLQTVALGGWIPQRIGHKANVFWRQRRSVVLSSLLVDSSLVYE